MKESKMKGKICRVGLTLFTALLLMFIFTLSALAAGSAKITTTAEQYGAAPCTVKVDVGSYFDDAAVVGIQGEGQTTGAVVDEGYIEFYLTKHGSFTVSDTGKTVVSMTLTDNLGSQSTDNDAYKGTGNGMKEKPLTVLADFANLASDVKKLQATWKGYNVFAGFDTVGTTARNSGAVKKILVEDRDETTGKLLGSFYVDGSQWQATQEADKGPYYMNYLLDPTDEYITSGYALDNHYSYTGNAAGGEERRTSALKLIKSVRDSKDSALFVQSRLRDYAGPITFKIYVGGLGKFEPGDTVGIAYLLGSSNRNVYHGIKPDLATLLADEPTYSKYYQDAGLTSIVDTDGYLSFTLYNGGYFALSKVTGGSSGTVWKMPDYSGVSSDDSTSAAEVYFSDVPIKHWAYVDIYAMAQEGVISGYADGTFKPFGNITKGEFLKLLLTVLNKTIQSGESGFTDADNSWAKDYVYTACQLGIVSDANGGAFGVNEDINREQVAVMICKAKSLPPLATDGFNDDDQISSWAKGYIGACKAGKYISGDADGNFRPQVLLTRAEAAAVIHKINNLG